MSTNYRISTFSALGELFARVLREGSLQPIIGQAAEENVWFTPASIRTAIQAICEKMLQQEALNRWLANYPVPDRFTPKNVGVVMAGNIPLVGFFDLLCVCICGHRCRVKYSSKDRVLMEWVVRTLRQIDPDTDIEPLDPDTPIDALIVSGSDSTLLHFQKRLSMELEQKVGKPVVVPILADVLEMKDEAWRGAVEGYLNTQKFYLLVDPACYPEAQKLYNQIKEEFGQNSFGIVDIGKLREKEKLHPLENSLAQKVETENDLARSYIDYLLGRVVCCARVEELRSHKTAITAEGMLYQGYVTRPLRRAWMEDAFIGRRAVALRLRSLEAELVRAQECIQHLPPILHVL